MTLEQYLTLVTTRHSVRSYDSQKPVPRDLLLKIAEAGRCAPTAANRQPFRILYVTDEPYLSRVRAAYPAPWFAEAPVVLAVIGRPVAAWSRRSDGYCAIETDCTIVMDHLILAAHAAGLGTCWIAAFNPTLLREALVLPPDEVVYAITPIGWEKPGAPPPQRSRRPLPEVCHFLPAERE